MRYGNRHKRSKGRKQRTAAKVAARAIALSAAIATPQELVWEIEENRAFHESRALQSMPMRRNSKNPKPTWNSASPGRKPRNTVQSFNGMEYMHAPTT